MTSSLIGRKLGKYQIVELIGQGGMATVYLGYQAEIDRYAAIKVLPPHPGLDPQFVERFRLEARTVARLQHPHILPLYDYGVEDDILYLAMAYADCGSLSDRIERGGLKLDEVADILRQTALALDYAHRQGVIHRDIKPDNILIDSEGFARLADFGIVKLAGGEAGLTATGGLVGTPAYMSPEQARGEAITPAADLYSLGIVAYEMLTGKKPYTADTPMQVVLKHINEPVPTLLDRRADLPPTLEAVLQRMLAKDPASRYPTASQFAEAFANAITGSRALGSPEAVRSTAEAAGLATTAPGAGASASATPAPSTIIVQQQGINPIVLLGGFALIAALLVGVVVVLVNGPRAAPAAPEATSAAGDPATQPTPPLAPAERTFGRLSYSAAEMPGDTVTLIVQGVRPPAAGRVYAAWLQNTLSGETVLMGELVVDAQGSGVLPPYRDPQGRPLWALYNAVAVTEQERMSAAPGGKVVYRASAPVQLPAALTQILISSPDGFPVQGDVPPAYSGLMSRDATGRPLESLVQSAVIEAETAGFHAGLAAGARNAGGMHLHAEHTINILEGTQTDYDGSGRAENPGRKVGVLRFLDLIEAQLDGVATAEGVTRRTQSDLELIRVCVLNTRRRVARVVELERALLAVSDVAAVEQEAAESTRLTTELVAGTDLNNNGQIEPFEGECGLNQIRDFGVLVAALDLLEAAP